MHHCLFLTAVVIVAGVLVLDTVIWPLCPSYRSQIIVSDLNVDISMIWKEFRLQLSLVFTHILSPFGTDDRHY